MFYVAKLIQVMGFAAVTYALMIGLSEEDALGRELRAMLFGAGVFYIGRLVERRAAA